jgi:hypothetical protein
MPKGWNMSIGRLIPDVALARTRDGQREEVANGRSLAVLSNAPELFLSRCHGRYLIIFDRVWEASCRAGSGVTD